MKNLKKLNNIKTDMLMKNKLFFTLAPVWAILLFVFSSCAEKEIVVPPEIKVESAMQIEQDGGEVSIPISIENLPSEDPDASKLSVKSSETWAHDFKVSPDKVMFTVNPNDSKAGSEPRTAKLSFSYPGAKSVEVLLTQTALAELQLSLELLLSTSSEYSVKCIPGDMESTYVLRTMSKEEFDALGSDEAVIAADIEAFKRPGWDGTPGSVENNLIKGETEDTWSFINTKTQVVYAYGLNADEAVTSKIYTLEVTPLPKPVINFDQPAEVPVEGGKVTVKYSIENPVEGEKIEITQPQVDWIRDITFTDTEITFTVDPNTAAAPGSDPRKGSFNVSYKEAYNKAVVVTQAAPEKVPELGLALSLVSVSSSEFTVKCTPDDAERTYVFRKMSKEEFDALGSDEAVIASDIEAFKRPGWDGTPGSVENNLIKGETEDTWSFINTKTQVVYAYGLNADEAVTSKIYTLEVTPLPKPVINFDQPAEVPVEGGKVTVKYSIENPVEGEKIEITQPQVDWIRDITFTDTEITFTVDPNTAAAPGSDPRKGSFNVSYKEAYNKAVVVTQAAPEKVPELDLVLDVLLLSPSQVKVKCTPSISDATYIFKMRSAEEMARYPTDDDLIAADIEEFTADTWFGPGTIKENLVSGVKENSWPLYSSTPKIYVYAYGLNEDGTVTGPVVKKEISTPARPVIVIEEQVTVPADGGVIKVRYSINNPIEGASLTVNQPFEDWIHVGQVTDSEIMLTVDSYNAAPGSRNRESVVSLSYPEIVSYPTFTVCQTAPEMQSEFDIELQVLDITSNSVKVKCVPSSDSGTYVVRSMMKEDYDLYKSDNDIVSEDIEYFTSYDWTTGKSGTIEENLKTGVQEVTLSIYGTYIWYVYAYGLNADGTRTTSITKVEIDPTAVR